MRDATLPLLAAVYGALQAALPDMMIYTDVPEGAEYPYVVIGDSAAVQDDTKTGLSQRHTIPVYVYRRETSRKTCLENIDAICGALHAAQMELSGFLLVSATYMRSGTSLIDAGNGLIWVGDAEFEFFTEAN